LVLNRIKGKIEEVRTERRAKKKIQRWKKAKALENEINRIRKQYPNLTFNEAKILAKKRLKKRRKRKTASKAAKFAKKALKYSTRMYTRRRRRRRW
jgi:hypothetical protein